LSQIRLAEKYLLFKDPGLKDSFNKSSSQFKESLETLCSLTKDESENEPIDEIAKLHASYVSEINKAVVVKKGRGEPADRRKEISDVILDKTDELIRYREDAIARKTQVARDIAAESAQMIAWMALGGISGAVLFAFLHARGVSSPLQQLAAAMRRVGRGQFPEKVDIRSPQEVHDLASTFNWMTAKLAELDRLKSDFTAHVSHELRTPLTAIKEGTALLLEEIPGRLESSQREILAVIRSHTDHLFQTISSILDLSKMEAEMMEYDFMPCDLGDIVQRSVHKTELIAQHKDISLDVRIEDGVPLLPLDEKRIQQVVDNLISNALKFTHYGGRVCVCVSPRRSGNGASDHVEVRVTDSGEGIAGDELERVFERFYQGRGGRAGSKQGTGLGLALSRYIVEAHHGKIWAESELGRGSTFIFTLPTGTVDAGAGSA
jgi:two-component system sensor histidine kinase GlrK